MPYKSYLQDNTCFIVPNSLKQEILFYISNNKLLVNVSFYNIEEVKRNLFFDYDEKTIYMLATHYHLSYDDAKLYIENMYYLNDKKLNHFKVTKLQEMKAYLDQNNLLKYNPTFINNLNKKKIITSYSKTSFFNEKIFSLLNNVTYLHNEISEEKEIYEFNFIEEEVEFIANKIASLIDSKVNINNIKLVNVKEEDLLFIKKIFSFFNIPLQLNNSTNSYETEIIKYFINNLKETNDLTLSLNNFKEKYPLINTRNNDFYNLIINVMNKFYYITDYKKDLTYLIEEFKKQYIREEKLANCIEIISLEEMNNNDNYYFLMGFNSYFPFLYKDEDYLSDKIKLELGFKTSTYINKEIKKYTLNKIKETKNIIISYKLKDYFNSYHISTLIDDLSYNLHQNYQNNNDFSYSSKYDKLKLSKYLDEFYKYSYKNSELEKLYSSYKGDYYNSYDNRFKGLEKNKFINYLNNELTLSYTSLDDFYNCSFKYYLTNLLKENTPTFASSIGNLFHYVLSKMYQKDFDFEKVYNEYLNTLNLLEKEKVLLIKIKETLKKDIDILNEQINKSSFVKCRCEENIKINIKSSISVILKGYIDKIMLTDDYKKAYIVDYKTGNPKFSFDYLENGLYMQLAIYMYLLNKSKEYADVFLVGCYLQKILDDDLNKEELKLEGYTFNDLNIVQEIDHNYQSGSFIKGIKATKDGGLGMYAKTFNSDTYKQIIETIGRKVKEAINDIIDNKFTINPKIVNGNNISCKYCEFKDICYRKYQDYIRIVKEGDEDEQELD